MDGQQVFCVGVVATVDGGYVHHDGRAGVCAAADYAVEQPSFVPVNLDHDDGLTVGRLVYLERVSRHGLIGVGRVIRSTVPEADGLPLRFSPGWDAHASGPVSRRDAKLFELSLSVDAATTNIGPVWFVDRLDSGYPVGFPAHLAGAAGRAHRWLRHGDPDRLTVEEPEIAADIAEFEAAADRAATTSASARQVHRVPRPLRRTVPATFTWL